MERIHITIFIIVSNYTYIGAELAQLVRWMTLNQEVPILNLDTTIWEKSACAVGQGTLIPKVVLYNHHLLSLNYEYGNGALEYFYFLFLFLLNRGKELSPQEPQSSNGGRLTDRVNMLNIVKAPYKYSNLPLPLHVFYG